MSASNEQKLVSKQIRKLMDRVMTHPDSEETTRQPLLFFNRAHMIKPKEETRVENLSIGKKCDDGEVYHMEYCYSFNEQPMNWADAAKHCNDQGRVLALTESEDDQTFYAGYIQGMLSTTQPFTQGVTGVWTSVRSVPNGSEPAWVVFPGSYMVAHYYWQPGEPNIYPNYEDVCVSLQQETMYRNWMSQTCDALNFVVCKKRAIDQEASKKRVTQCICGNGFGGIRCEHRVEGTSSQNISCMAEPFEFLCLSGGTIHVEYASYGAVEGYACSQQLLSLRQTCSNPNTLKTITNMCEGLNYCTIQELKKVFPETPCPVPEEMFLQYRFICSEGLRTHELWMQDTFRETITCFHKRSLWLSVH